MNTVIGLFQDFDDAERAIEQLTKAGFARDDIGILARGYLVQERLGDVAGNDMLESAGTGALAGTAIGGVLGLLASGVAIGIPVLGPLVAAGTLATTLGGAAAGAVYGSLIGALLSLGVREEEAEFFADGIGEGGVMVFVQAEGERAADAWYVMRQAKAVSAPSQAEAAVKGVADSPVVGLFASHQDAYDAVEALHAQGFTHRDIEVVDQARLGHLARPQPGDSMVHGVNVGREAVDTVAIDPPAHLIDPAGYLATLGVPEQNTSFFAGAIQRGGTLLIVKVAGERAQVAWQTMQDKNAMNLTEQN